MNKTNATFINELQKLVKDVHDFPKPGVNFKDIAPLLANAKMFKKFIKHFAKQVKDCDYIVAPDARGFLFGAPVALMAKKPFIMVRKPKKLPGEVISQSYDLEYGSNTLEMQANIVQKHSKIAIIDDVLATGGTLEAICKLVQKQEAKVSKILVLAELEFFNAKSKFEKQNIEVHSLLKY